MNDKERLNCILWPRTKTRQNGQMEKSPVNQSDKNKTPVKVNSEVQSDAVTPLKELNNLDAVKSKEKSLEEKINQNKTPEKITSSDHDQRGDLVDNDDGMLSTVEQARLLIAASKTPSKTVNRTPVKQSDPNRKRSIESSPITPGKQRRVELITLSSPKTKRFKQG